MSPTSWKALLNVPSEPGVAPVSRLAVLPGAAKNSASYAPTRSNVVRRTLYRPGAGKVTVWYVSPACRSPLKLKEVGAVAAPPVSMLLKLRLKPSLLLTPKVYSLDPGTVRLVPLAGAAAPP